MLNKSKKNATIQVITVLGVDVMSIMQDYEILRRQLGTKKYKALEEYINTFGKIAEWEQGIKDIRSIEDIKEWEKANTELHQRCKPVFIEDVAMNEEEWNKFEMWYKDKSNK